MRLLQLHGDEVSLVEYVGKDIPQYAILSHTWGDDHDEVTFKDLAEGKGRDKAGYSKLVFCGKQATEDGLRFFWVDTCCIDKSSSAELSEAINSMFQWYQNATKCYVYLSDMSTTDLSRRDQYIGKCRWFTRGWTLQELIAPVSVEFFSASGYRLGDKLSLCHSLYEITGIAIEALQGNPLSKFTVDERMSWAKNRETKRGEDAAYSLLGLFDVHMPLIYGEGREKALKRLCREIKEASGGARPLLSPTCNVPFRRDPDFVDRGTLLDLIHEKCSAPASRIALVGLGGVGKSQLAIEYCYRTVHMSPETWVFWVHASNAARLEQSFRDIADRVDIAGRKDTQANVFKLVHDWLRDEKHGRWLLVIDNADDTTVLDPESNSNNRPLYHISTYLPPSIYGSVLITSRTKQVAWQLVEDSDIIQIGPMHDTDAKSLLEKKLGDNVNKEGMVELAAALEYMPLALVQAAAYIRKQAPRCSVRQYLEKFRKSDKKKIDLLDYESANLRRDKEAKNSIMTTWQISFDHIRSVMPLAADLLSLMSFFDRQGIPEELLHDLGSPAEERDRLGTENADEDSDEDRTSEASTSDRFEKAVSMLRDYYIISTAADVATFDMHSLIQLATREWLESQGQLERWRQQYIANLCAEFPIGEYENWQRCQILFPHAIVALSQKPKSEESLGIWALLLYKAAWYSWRRGNADEAENMATQSMKVTIKLLGKDSMETCKSMAMIGLAKSTKGQWKEAEELEVEVMETRLKKLGPDHLDTLTSMSNLATTYWNQGRWKEAEILHVEVMEARKNKLGASHPDTLTSMANLASTYRNQGLWEAAELLQVEVIETRKKALGVDHPSTLTSMANLASTYRNQCRWEAAETLDLEVLKASKKVLGLDHPNTLISMANLASTYGSQGRWEAAETLGVEVIEMCKKKLGADHPDTLTGMANLASTYRYRNRWEAAEALELKVLEMSKKVLGVDHPDTLSYMNNLAFTWKTGGLDAKAIDIMRECVQLRHRVLGDHHPSYLSSCQTLAKWEAV